MILPTIESFERVTGDLDKIRLDVDVMQNRIGSEKNVLYGKDIAALMEHSCVRHFVLNGMNIRGCGEQHEEDDLIRGRTFPASFSRVIDRSFSNYMPHVHKNEYFRDGEYGTVPKFRLTMKYCMGFPSFNPNCEFTSVPVVSESTGYAGQDMTVGMPIYLSQLNAWMEDAKLQHYFSVSVVPFPLTGDEFVFYDEHGTYFYLYNYYCYFATPRGDAWRIIGGSGAKPMSISYPTQHISRAQMWMYVPSIDVSRHWYDSDGTTHDEGYSLGQFVFKVFESTDGNLIIDQDRMVSCVKNAITSSGHTFYTMGNVGHGFDYRDDFYFRFNPVIVIVFEADNHTKWW